MAEILSNNKIPRIYAYTEPQYKETIWQGKRQGKGLIKVGFTTRLSAIERVAEQFGTSKPTSTPFEMLLDEIAIRNDNTYFTDHEVHKVLEKLGCYRFPNSEWFECTLEEVQQAIFAVKNHKTEVSKRIANFKMRPEQEQAVKVTSEHFRRYPYAVEHKTPHFLWNAKMRFAPDRALKQIADYSARLNVNADEKPEQKVQEFISFLPVLCYDGSRMEQISADELLDLVVAGTASSMLARRWESALLVNVDNETLAKLLENENAMNALEKIESFRNLNKELKALVNKSEALKKQNKKNKIL